MQKNTHCSKLKLDCKISDTFKYTYRIVSKVLINLYSFKIFEITYCICIYLIILFEI